MRLEINKMTVKDLNLISKNLYDDFDDFWTYSVFKSELENNNSKYIVAKQNNEIVGFAGIWIAIDVAHITNIVVKKSMRKNGIGSLLLQELINMFKKLGLNEITLEVNEQNSSAIHLYQNFGFRQVGLRKKYYRNGDNAIIMTRDKDAIKYFCRKD
ncbi:MAG: ribosomal protein S18-alanine N-acetyltransferase [Clostridia bacterium]|nr:ribosomal protein S18-alanine N-acetyltransferase [Clostridia bacterium]